MHRGGARGPAPAPRRPCCCGSRWPGRTDHLPGQHYVFRLTRRGRLHRVPVLLGRLLARPTRCWSSASSGSTTARCRRTSPTSSRSATSSSCAARSAAGSSGTATTPAVGVAGGTGVVPLVAMLRHARDLGRAGPARRAGLGPHPCDELPYRRRARRRTGLVLTRRGVDGRRGRPADRRRPPRRCWASDGRGASTSAGRPGSPRPPAGCSWTSACRRPSCAWSGSGRPAT